MATSFALGAPLTPQPKITTKSTVWGRVRSFGQPPRIVALDIARGLAVIGMVAAHTLDVYGGMVWNDPTTWPEIASGRSSILFALLAGISIALMTGRSRVPAGAELTPLRLGLLGRGLVIFLIGLVLELLGTSVAVILTFFGVVYAVSIVFIGMRIRSLLIWAGALAVAGPAVAAGLQALSPFGGGDGMAFVLGGTYSIVVWTALTVAGLALGRLDLNRRKVAALTAAVGVGLCVLGTAAGAVWNAAEETAWEDSSGSLEKYDDITLTPGAEVNLNGLVCEDYGDDFISCYPEGDFEEKSFVDSFEDSGSNGWATYAEEISVENPGLTMLSALMSGSPHSGGTMEILGSGGLAMALVGLLALTRQALRHVLLPLAAVGSMPLTAYSAHVVIIWIMLGPGGWTEGTGLFWGITVGLLIGCAAWAILAGRGPLERLTGWCSARLVNSGRPDVVARL